MLAKWGYAPQTNCPIEHGALFPPRPWHCTLLHSGRDGEGSERWRYRGYKYTKVLGVAEYWMENLKNYFFEPVWWYIPIIQVFRNSRQKNHDFQTRLGHMIKSCLIFFLSLSYFSTILAYTIYAHICIYNYIRISISNMLLFPKFCFMSTKFLCVYWLSLLDWS